MKGNSRFNLALFSRLTIISLLVLPLIFVRSTSAQPGHLLQVSFINVGQGDSILIQFPNAETMLIDAGPGNAGDDVVAYLNSQNIQHLDYLLSTHPHFDHIAGMIDVLDYCDVDEAWDSGFIYSSMTQMKYLFRLLEEGVDFRYVRSGYHQIIGDVAIDVLAPYQQFLSNTHSDINNSSVVICLTYNNVSFLFTGDMEAEERAVLADWPDIDILKAAHHGSSNGTDAAFVADITPALAVISYGHGNTYGHPHDTAVRALSDAHCSVHMTADEGTIIVSTDGITYDTNFLGPDFQPVNPSANYVGNANSHVLHLPTCLFLPDEANRIYFTTRDEAINAGYRPCGICSP